LKWADILKRRPLKINKPDLPELLVGSKPRKIYDRFKEVAYSIELFEEYLNSFIMHVYSVEEPTPPPILPSGATNDPMMNVAAKLEVAEKVSIEELLENRVSLYDLILDYESLINRMTVDAQEQKRKVVYDRNYRSRDDGSEEIYLPIFNTFLDTLRSMEEYLTGFMITHSEFIDNQKRIVTNKGGN